MDKDIERVLTRRVESVLPSKEALKKLLKKKKIRLYQGFDPTGGRLHLGHSVGLRKLMEFAKLGHEVIFLFGTGTVLVGDPSQRETGRKKITEAQIRKNIKDWKKQAESLVDFSKVKIMYNGDWLGKLTLKDIIKIASYISAIQLFKRDMFQKRLERGDTVWYHETMYPILQGYDSVVMDVDLEIGGTDQEFNMLIGRELVKKMKNKEKYVLTTPMILGTDGKQMSKTGRNCVWLDDKPNEMFGKIMSIPDNQIVPYLELATNLPIEKVKQIKDDLKDEKLNPMDAKKVLAETVVSQLHTPKEASYAKRYFEKTFQESKPEYQKEVKFQDNLLKTASLASGASISETKRLILQGAVDVNGNTVKDPLFKLKGGEKLKIGKRIFVKVKKK
jgi:tyrosyl-tRNA synthetase